MHYTVTRLKDRSQQNNLAALQSFRERSLPEGIGLFGLFTPLFGMATNEFYAVTWSEQPHQLVAFASALDLEVGEQQGLEPTVRPTEHRPCSKPGIYVFRWFRVDMNNVDEIARLSREAWVTFEGGFQTEVQGLFRESTPAADTGAMLLITQYDDLSVWEASRMPAPEARENFLARARLTIEATPIATRLVI